MNKEIKYDEIIQQPLLTDEGYLNPACMNELTSAINNMPKTFDRLKGDDEWNNKKDQWTLKKDIVGAFAMWATKRPIHRPNCWIRKYEGICKDLAYRTNEEQLQMLKELGWKEDTMWGSAILCDCGLKEAQDKCI